MVSLNLWMNCMRQHFYKDASTFNFSRRRKIRAVILCSEGKRPNPLGCIAYILHTTHAYGRLHRMNHLENFILITFTLELPFRSQALCSGCANLFSFQALCGLGGDQIWRRLHTRARHTQHNSNSIHSKHVRSLRIEWFDSSQDENAIFRCICNSNWIWLNKVKIISMKFIVYCEFPKIKDANTPQFIHGPNLFIHHYHLFQRIWVKSVFSVCVFFFFRISFRCSQIQSRSVDFVCIRCALKLTRCSYLIVVVGEWKSKRHLQIK